ncbi:MAG TPA: hypothetical protein VMT00_04275 [Thermoanaerobaculia bacterium]|nr:hypothetical protein [Thermoanaerobaculia bacterium]
MSVAEIGQLHRRYVRLSDTFKAFWTFHQFASSAYKNFLQLSLPYNFDFQRLYESIRATSELFQSAAPPPDAAARIERCESDLQKIAAALMAADLAIKPSILRRFFEKLKQQDEKIVFNLIKFYLYSGRLSGDQRDKIDFLITKIGEEYLEDRGDFRARDSGELKGQFQGLLSIVQVRADEEDIARVVRQIREIKEQILDAPEFEQLASGNLLERLRSFKHEIGELYFHPDVLLAIVDCNVAAKNRFLRLYREEEQQILADSQRLVTHEEAIRKRLTSNPELIDEIERFRQFKQEFDESRARSDVKHTVITRLKMSIHAILSEIESELDAAGDGVVFGGRSVVLDSAPRADRIEASFGADPLLYDHLARIIGLLDEVDVTGGEEQIASHPSLHPIRLEPWEAGAYLKLFRNAPMEEEETNDLMLLYLRAAAIRLLIDEQARKLATVPESDDPSPTLLVAIRESLDRAKELDQMFGDSLHEGIYFTDPKVLHRLYRSRFRLLRGFSGLWLIYDQRAGAA